jgi:hypothetical protein
LYVGSIYNSPDPNLATLLRNDRAEFPKILDAPLAGRGSSNHVALKDGQPDVVCAIINAETGDFFRAENLSTGKPVQVAVVTGLASGSDYAVGSFRGKPLREFVFYKAGESKLNVRPVEESAGQVQFGNGASFDVVQPVAKVVTLAQEGGQKLLVIFGEGDSAGLFNFDGIKAPTLVQTIYATNETFTCAASVAGAL